MTNYIQCHIYTLRLGILEPIVAGFTDALEVCGYCVLCVWENSSEMGLNSQHASGCTSVLYEVMQQTKAIKPLIVREQDRAQQTHIHTQRHSPNEKRARSQYTVSRSNSTAILISPHTVCDISSQKLFIRCYVNHTKSKTCQM